MMKNLVKLVAMAVVVFQAEAMNNEKRADIALDNPNQWVVSAADTKKALNALKALNNQQPVTEEGESNENSSNQLEYLRELDKNIYAILNDTTPDQAPEPTNEDLMKVQSEVDSILGENSEDNMNERTHGNNDPIQQAIDEALDIIQNEKVVRGDEDGKLYNLIQRQNNPDPDIIKEMVWYLNQQPVDIRLDTRIVFDENGQPDLIVRNRN